MESPIPSTTSSSPPVTYQQQQGMATLSNTTKHSLIAAASVAAALLVALAIHILYRRRRRTGYPNAIGSGNPRISKPYVTPPLGLHWENQYTLKRDVEDVWSWQPIRQPPSREQASWHPPSWEPSYRHPPSWEPPSKEQPSRESSIHQYPLRPAPAVTRPTTASSNRALVDPPTTPAQEAPQDEPAPFLIDDSCPPSPKEQKEYPLSIVPSSPILPAEQGNAELFDETITSVESLPVYLQNNDSSIDNKLVSRFSWTNTQAPNTPAESRLSVATSRSSIPRYRTVDSWVGAQAGRLDYARLQDHFRQEIEAQFRDGVPSVPAIPPLDEFGNLLTASPKPATQTSTAAAAAAAAAAQRETAAPEAATTVSTSGRKPAPILAPAPKTRAFNRSSVEEAEMHDQTRDSLERERVSIKRMHSGHSRSRSRKRRARDRARISDATVFRVHPGTEVVLEPGPRVPSEVLDQSLLQTGAL